VGGNPSVGTFTLEHTAWQVFVFPPVLYHLYFVTSKSWEAAQLLNDLANVTTFNLK
jgi:hypothetical protein